MPPSSKTSSCWLSTNAPSAGDIIRLNGLPTRRFLLLEDPHEERPEPLWMSGSNSERRLLRAIYGSRLGRAPVYAAPVGDVEYGHYDIALDDDIAGSIVVYDRQAALLPSWAIHADAQVVSRVSPLTLAAVLRRPHSPWSGCVGWSDSMEHRGFLMRLSADFDLLSRMVDAH